MTIIFDHPQIVTVAWAGLERGKGRLSINNLPNVFDAERLAHLAKTLAGIAEFPDQPIREFIILPGFPGKSSE